MATQAQILANRQNAAKSTGPKTAEGKAVVAQNATKHGLFAQENVIQCENQSDFECFGEKLLAGLAPVGGVEAMLAERIVSLSWRLKRVERMNSEVVDVMIAKVETNSLERRWRREAGLVDTESGKSELALGWAMIVDFSKSQVLERLLMYEKRIESSLYKAMKELEKLQGLREKEQAKMEEAIPSASGFETATRRGQDARETRGRDALATGGQRLTKQSQSVGSVETTPAISNASGFETGARRGQDARETQGRDARDTGEDARSKKQSQSATSGRF